MTTARSAQLRHRGLHRSIDLKRHEAKCAVCKSEDRLEIEAAFLHWLSPGYIVEQFDVPNRMTLYRHVHATGLFEYRRRNLRSALERLIENAADARVSGDCVIRAVRALSRVSEDGRWTEPVQQVIVSRRPVSLALAQIDPQDVVHKEILIDTQKRTEIPATSTKQTTDLIPDRDKSGVQEVQREPTIHKSW